MAGLPAHYRSGTYLKGVHDQWMKGAFDLRPEQKWPDRGLLPRSLDGIDVWVMAKNDAKFAKITMRVRASCPHCEKTPSASRLWQHMKVHS